MRTLYKSWIIRALALLFAASAAFAQDRVPFRQEELDQMLAPVALYPDSLLSHMLMAATYPLEVVQAARWSRANPGLKGQDAVRAVERMDWDASVKSLTAFPQVLSMMDEKLEWTERLGEAFLAQQSDVMSTVQGLRRRADAKGNLKSGDQMRVVREREAIVIQQPAPEVVYVPYYSPAVVYGPWWWPAYPPVFWAPPPAYYAVPAYGPAFFWGSGIVISSGFFFGHFDWHNRHVNVAHGHHYRHDARPTHGYSAWRHDSVHRRGVPFRNSDARQRFEQSRTVADARRGAERGDAARIERRADDNRTADIRQRRLEERGNTIQERRDTAQGRRGDDRLDSGKRLSLNDDGNRARSAQADARAAQPEARRAHAETRDAQRDARTAQPETRSAQPDARIQPETRQARPETRSSQPDRDVRPGRSERSVPQAGDRRGERGEFRDAPRSQGRSAEAQPGVATFTARSEPRPAAAPAARAELRRSTPAANTLAAPQRAFEDRRAEARAAPQQHRVARESVPALRPAANAPAPRNERSARRDDGRRS